MGIYGGVWPTLGKATGICAVVESMFSDPNVADGRFTEKPPPPDRGQVYKGLPARAEAFDVPSRVITPAITDPCETYQQLFSRSRADNLHATLHSLPFCSIDQYR
jgi:hypothetical protein